MNSKSKKLSSAQSEGHDAFYVLVAKKQTEAQFLTLASQTVLINQSINNCLIKFKADKRHNCNYNRESIVRSSKLGFIRFQKRLEKCNMIFKTRHTCNICYIYVFHLSLCVKEVGISCNPRRDEHDTHFSVHERRRSVTYFSGETDV